MHSRASKPHALIAVWLYGPLAGAVGCLVLFIYFLARGGGPPETRLLLKVATAAGALVGTSAIASVLRGPSLLAGDDPSEPLNFKEAGWALGLPLGVLGGTIFVINRHPDLQVTFFVAFLGPLLIIIAFCIVAWATLTRSLVSRLGYALSDYACAAVLPPEDYALLARHKRAWRAAARPLTLSFEQARDLAPDIIPALRRRRQRVRKTAEIAHIEKLLTNLSEAPEKEHDQPTGNSRHE